MAADPQIKLQPILVWDVPVRIFHWLLVTCCVGAWVTSESERLMMWHLAFGYSAGLLVLLRVVWGLIGSRYARFSSFASTPRETLAYLRAMLTGRSDHPVGHNPLGGWMIWALLSCVLLTVASGYLLYHEILTWDDLHEGFANLGLGLVLAHVAAAVVMGWVEKQSLVKAMLHGRKMGRPEQAIRRPWYTVGTLLLVVMVYVFVEILQGKLPALTS
ncbi:MAG: cytochrome b [Limnohabitans sp.]|jgi:cytochrome b|nr:cytochrome b [Limnohabitans sp.]